MGIVTGIIVYIVIWWCIFFMALPIGVRIPERIQEGHATSAPSAPWIGQKVLWTTIISFIIFLGAYYFIETKLISFRPA